MTNPEKIQRLLMWAKYEKTNDSPYFLTNPSLFL